MRSELFELIYSGERCLQTASLCSVEYAAGPPSFWKIILTSGVDIELWADGYSVADNRYVFTVLVRATNQELSDVRVTTWPHSDSQVAEILVAAIPKNEVAAVEGGWGMSEMAAVYAPIE